MSTIKQLNALSKNIPGAVAAATNQMQLQQQLAAVPAIAPTTSTAEQLAAQQQAQATQIQLGQQAQTVQQQAGLQQQALSVQATEQQAELQDAALQQQAKLEQQEIQTNIKLLQQQQAASENLLNMEIRASKRVQDLGLEVDYKLTNINQEQRLQLAKLGSNVRHEILDKRLTFERDEAGRRFKNEIQLLDWKATQQLKQNEWEKTMEDISSMWNMKLLLLKSAHQVNINAKKEEYLRDKTELDIASRQRIAGLTAEAQTQQAKEAAKAKNSMMFWTTVGTVVGAVVGSMFGIGPVGGAAIGGAAGAAVGGVAEANPEYEMTAPGGRKVKVQEWGRALSDGRI